MMQGGGGSNVLATGGPAPHIPVLLEAVLAALQPVAGNRFIDGTFGAGGYSRALLEAGAAGVLGIDRDPTAIAAGRALAEASSGRLALAQGLFGNLDILAEAAGWGAPDGVVLDIGVSSMQLDRPERGFSFRQDGPLDMRMAADGVSAADLVNNLDETELANIIYRYGEERLSRRIARAIVADRKQTPFTNTLQLAGLIARIVPHKPTDIHPATRTFQALRIAVNDELGELRRALEAAEQILPPGGRLAVVSFHSLEDRIVKQFFAERTGRGQAASRLLPGEAPPPPRTFATPGKQPVTAGELETKSNPRSRSARLRFALRTEAPCESGERRSS
ncbi:MAG: 16S rRNA (cytosine(1402)-N(4))-methyltransferase RsmH [Beijerinckiaceae bacterium]